MTPPTSPAANPYYGPDLIVRIINNAPAPVDVLILGSFTDLAWAIQKDNAIVDNIGTVFISGGDYNYTGPFVPSSWPYPSKTKGSAWNLFVDPLATERVLKSGIQNFVAMAKAAQDMLVTDMSMIDALGKPPVTPSQVMLYNITGKFAACTNQPDSSIKFWDESAAAMMLQLKAAGMERTPSLMPADQTFCTQWASNKDSINLVNGSHFGIPFPDAKYGVTIQSCTVVDPKAFVATYWDYMMAEPVCTPVMKITQPGWWENGRLLLSGKRASAEAVRARRASLLRR